jgi:pimeloyl-ACP methyl ester carboxylesterase
MSESALPGYSIFVDLPGGIRLHGQRSGDGEPLFLLVHGLADNLFVWSQFVASVAAQGSCVAIDLRGHGGSQWDPIGHYTVALHAADLLLAAEALQLGSFILVGHSIGADVAIHIAATNPERVRALVIVDGGPGTKSATAAVIKHLLAKQRRPYRSIDEYAGAIGRRLGVLEIAPLQELAAAGLCVGANGGFELNFDPRVAQVMVDRNDDELWDLLQVVRCDILVIRGARSAVLPQGAADAMVQKLERCSLSTIPASGHAVMLENPEYFQAAVGQFLSTCNFGQSSRMRTSDCLHV